MLRGNLHWEKCSNCLSNQNVHVETPGGGSVYCKTKLVVTDEKSIVVPY